MGSTIITAAINGATVHRAQCANVPFTPEEIAAEAQRVYDAGASVVLFHAREPGGAVSYRPEQYRAVIEAIRERCPILIAVDTGAIGVSLEDRCAGLEAQPDLAAVPIGTLSVARYNTGQRSFDYDLVLANPFATVVDILRRHRLHGITPVLTCHDVGHVAALQPLMEMEVLSDAPSCSLVVGVVGGAPAAPRQLAQLADLVPNRSRWEVVCKADQSWPMLAAGCILGGGIRVGLEDSIYLADGSAASGNGDLVERAAALVRAVGGEPANVEEAKTSLIGLELGRM